MVKIDRSAVRGIFDPARISCAALTAANALTGTLVQSPIACRIQSIQSQLRARMTVHRSLPIPLRCQHQVFIYAYAHFMGLPKSKLRGRQAVFSCTSVPVQRQATVLLNANGIGIAVGDCKLRFGYSLFCSLNQKLKGKTRLIHPQHPGQLERRFLVAVLKRFDEPNQRLLHILGRSQTVGICTTQQVLGNRMTLLG